MEDKGKAAVILGGLTLAGLGVYLAAKAEAAPPTPPPEGVAASIEIKVSDSQGNPVTHSSPYTLDEGERYVVTVIVTNLSTKMGVPCKAVLSVSTVVEAGGYDLITAGGDFLNQPFLANQEIAFGNTVQVPVGFGGLTGWIDSRVIDPEYNIIATVTEPITIRVVETVYSAEISIKVS